MLRLPLSMMLGRSTVDLGKDFSDGVMFGEIIHYYLPDKVNMHDLYDKRGAKNWSMLSTKFLRRMGFDLHKEDVEVIVKKRRGAAEVVGPILCKVPPQQSVFAAPAHSPTDTLASTADVPRVRAARGAAAARGQGEGQRQVEEARRPVRPDQVQGGRLHQHSPGGP